ncbi:MAG: hypothetical protein H6711_02855 [Myxococcales bacterium]|nr:hypothetical protein [Myxococcales bacterium]
MGERASTEPGPREGRVAGLQSGQRRRREAPAAAPDERVDPLAEGGRRRQRIVVGDRHGLERGQELARPPVIVDLAVAGDRPPRQAPEEERPSRSAARLRLLDGDHLGEPAPEAGRRPAPVGLDLLGEAAAASVLLEDPRGAAPAGSLDLPEGGRALAGRERPPPELGRRAPEGGRGPGEASGRRRLRHGRYP